MTIGAIPGAFVLALAAILPGWAVVAFLAPKFDRAGRAGTALALSPILGGAAVALFVQAGMSWGSSVVSLLTLSLAVVLLRRLLPRGSGPDLRGNGPDAAWLAALAAPLVVAAMFVTSEWWRIASDAWTQAPIVHSLRVHGLPPQGLPLQDALPYHAWVAGLAEVTHANAFTIMAFLAVASLASFALLAGHFVGRFHGRDAGGATAFVLLAMNGAFVFMLPIVVLEALGGGHHAPARSFGIATDATRAEALLRWFGAQPWFGKAFTNSTPFSLGLAAYAAWLASLWRGLDRGARDRRELALFALLTAATGAVHPVLLLSTGVSVALWFVLVLAYARGQAGAAFRLALAAAAGAVLPALFLAPGAPQVGLSLPGLLGLALSIAPALVFALVALPALARTDGPRRAWLCFLAAALAFALLLRATVDTTSYLAYVPLALTGGAAFAAWSARGTWPRVLAFLILAPATALALGSRLADPRGAWRQPWQRGAMVELRKGLPRDALLVVPPGDLDTPVFLERDTYDIDGALVDTLYRAGRLDPALAERLARTGRPVYAIWPDMARPWQAQTPGAPLRKMTTSGLRPAWGLGLPVEEYGEDYAVTPLTLSARLP